LGAFVVATSYAEDYGRHIYELALYRRLITLGQRMIDEASRPRPDGPHALDQIERVERELYDLATQGHEKSFVPFDHALSRAVDAIERAYKNPSHVIGVTTGLTDIDKHLGGLHASDLVVVAARPGMGKTSLATNIAFNAAAAHLNTSGQSGAR